MSEKRKKIYHALVDGATEGLSDKALYEFVVQRCRKASSKKIVRAAMLALTDPDVTDRHVLNTIFALAIKHRIDEIGRGDLEQDDGENEHPGPVPSRKRVKKEPDASVLASPAAPNLTAA
ncbi:hypothetical protein ACQKP1_24205 [Allorhizobium sp. NPDC080224]|uniref:Uncharacterized protein n=2 Tax=Alphaproteobacteria TaxID=28211 RepID=A0A512HKE0_9HYPH|nr:MULTISPECIES: hypothetical protein [Alphaproteobacteria]HCL64079.1 hypothetical protein [Rhizobium sp.]NTE55330.1 hypothetical protein [Agrobacterium tumefaciens]NTE72766.1 hypothetical protein [Agrobacterium tumefaciens]GEO85913.1 hypothetical protein RNA01_28450 [Ciceribacter naphthalenivorans]GLR23535.1 hypothetical protein GCM10007920_33260 [Ciceribacter naphthalenivorans]